MDYLFGGKRENDLWTQIIDGLMVNNEDLFMTTLYKAVSNHPSYVILSELEPIKKNKILDVMLNYFEGQEDFEKCITIMDIKKELNYTC